MPPVEAGGGESSIGEGRKPSQDKGAERRQRNKNPAKVQARKKLLTEVESCDTLWAQLNSSATFSNRLLSPYYLNLCSARCIQPKLYSEAPDANAFIS